MGANLLTAAKQIADSNPEGIGQRQIWPFRAWVIPNVTLAVTAVKTKSSEGPRLCSAFINALVESKQRSVSSLALCMLAVQLQ